MPMNWIGASTPPMVRLAGSFGFGSNAAGVVGAGDAPVASGGDTAPSPVMKRIDVWPRAPLREGTGKPLPSVKIPGAAPETTNLKVAFLNPSEETTNRVARPGWVS